MITRKKLKVLLIQPPRTFLVSKESKRVYPPTGLAYIASSLLESGFDVHILDAVADGFGVDTEIEPGVLRYGLSYCDIAARIENYCPDIVAVSCLQFMNARQAHEVCAIARSLVPKACIVMGGGYPTVLPERVISDSNIDFAVVGEGEEIFVRLAQNLEAGCLPESGSGLVKAGDTLPAQRAPYVNLDTLPMPAWDLLDMKKYTHLNPSPFGRRRVKGRYFAPLLTSRGCFGSCRFCSTKDIWGGCFRPRRPVDVVDEIAMMYEKGFSEFHLFDDHLTADQARAARIFDLIIERKLNISWYAVEGLSVSSLINSKLLEKMARSGCYRICLPIETVSSRLLASMDKNVSVDNIPELVRRIKGLGMFADAVFLIGYPGETEDDRGRLLDFVMSSELDDVSFNIVTPFPGTRLFDDCIKQGSISPDIRLDDLRFSRALISAPEVVPEEIEAFRYSAWKQACQRKVTV